MDNHKNKDLLMVNSAEWDADHVTLCYATMDAFDAYKLHRSNAFGQSRYTYADVLPKPASLERGANHKLFANSLGLNNLYELGSDLLLATNIGIPGMVINGTMPYQHQLIFDKEKEEQNLYARELGNKLYEITDHLGNVRATITDKLAYNGTNYEADLTSSSTYYPFGMSIGTLSDISDYRFGFNGKEKDQNGEFGLTHYDYGFRIYSPAIGKFLSIDPLFKEYPELTTYQFASNSPIVAIDLDGLEAKIAIYGTGKNKGDKSQFKVEADYDVKMKASNSPHFILTGEKFIALLKDKTSEEGSIGRLSVFSHSTPHGAYLDDTPGDYGGILRSRFKGLKASNPAYNNTETVSEIVDNMKSGDIKFEKDAVVIFAGCNTACEKDDKGQIKGNPLAKDFTFLTGVTSVGAVGNTTPNNDGTGSRTAGDGYYMFERQKVGKGKYSLKSTFLGKSINPSDYKYRDKEQLEPMKRIETINLKSNK